VTDIRDVVAVAIFAATVVISTCFYNILFFVVAYIAVQLVDLDFAVDRFTRPSIVEIFRRRLRHYRSVAVCVRTNIVLRRVGRTCASIELFDVQILLYRATSFSLPPVRRFKIRRIHTPVISIQPQTKWRL